MKSNQNRNLTSKTLTGASLFLAMLLGVTLMACPAKEKDTGDKIEDAIEDAADTVGDAAEDAADAVDDAVDATADAAVNAADAVTEEAKELRDKMKDDDQ